jgi:two-component system chemotaxis response regulator CheY
LPKKILVIEDDPDARNLIETVLKLEGFVVTLAADGREGLDKVSLESPDLIITDISMPRLDGLSLIQLLRTMPLFRTVPILAITSFGTERATTALRAGANRALARPIRNELLVEFVNNLLKIESDQSLNAYGSP